MPRTALKLTFQERLGYYRNEGFPTPKTTFPFNMLAGVFESKGVMADRAGLCSDDLFDTLEDWEAQLKATDFEGLEL